MKAVGDDNAVIWRGYVTVFSDIVGSRRNRY
ncbi:MAG: hypothetical protein ACI8WB_003965, partial [Phenylobacterium sp.]